MMRVYTGADNESHIEEVAIDWAENDATRTALEGSAAIVFAKRLAGSVIDFHVAPRRQYVLYLTASVELGLGDGSSVLMEPGDVLRAEDTTGHGHTSTVRQEGICAFVHIAD